MRVARARLALRRRDATPEHLSAAFADLLGEGGAPSRLDGVVGVEHEYQVLDGQTQVPFRPLLDGLDLGQSHLEPSDPNAYPLASGAMLTCDGREAEISLPPTPIDPGFSRVASVAAGAERDRLAAVLGGRYGLAGYSTHLSVATPREVGERVATMFAGRFAVPMMLFLDRADSPGLLVRPRPGRTELGGEHVTGTPLAHALVLAAAMVRWCVRQASTGPKVRGDSQPPIVEARVVADPERFGWYVDRCSFGRDLYAQGRCTVLRAAGGGSISAQAVLESAWNAVRGDIEGLASDAELSGVDAVVHGEMPLPLEAVDGHAEDRAGAVEGTGSGADMPPDPRGFGHPTELRPRRRADVGIELAPVMVTWETVMFLAVDDTRSNSAFVVVPRPQLGSFIDLLDSGHLDDVVPRYLRCAKGDRLIGSYEDTARGGLHDGFTSRRDLLAPERDPADQLTYRAR